MSNRRKRTIEYLRRLAASEQRRVLGFAEALGWSAAEAASRARLAAMLLCERALRLPASYIKWLGIFGGLHGPPLLTADEAERVVRFRFRHEVDDRIVSYRVIEARCCRMAYPWPSATVSRCEGPATFEAHRAGLTARHSFILEYAQARGLLLGRPDVFIHDSALVER